jgi:uncharacterized protein (DUF2225 family)
MTTIYKKEITCGVCGEKSEHALIGSTNAFGSVDLDTRPPADMRYTIYTWVQRCPYCGYCATNIEGVSESAEAIIGSRKYQLQLMNDQYPKLANSFLCKVMLKKVKGDLPGAIWSTIHAAWACDDSGNNESAKQCRIKAVELIKNAVSRGQTISDEPEADIAITVDLLRRSGQFGEGLQIIDQNHNEIKDEIIKKVLKFQKELILRSDHQCYTISECLG